MIRLRRTLERGRAHPVLGPILRARARAACSRWCSCMRRRTGRTRRPRSEPSAWPSSRFSGRSSSSGCAGHVAVDRWWRCAATAGHRSRSISAGSRCSRRPVRRRSPLHFDVEQARAARRVRHALQSKKESSACRSDPTASAGNAQAPALPGWSQPAVCRHPAPRGRRRGEREPVDQGQARAGGGHPRRDPGTRRGGRRCRRALQRRELRAGEAHVRARRDTRGPDAGPDSCRRSRSSASRYGCASSTSAARAHRRSR